MVFRIFGQVRELENQSGVSGVVVRGMDKDFLFDDLLGEVTTDQNGSFSIEYTEEAYKGLFDEKPDIYLVIKSESGKVLKVTQNDILFDADREIEINVDISRPTLVEAGLRKQEPAQWMKNLDPERLKNFSRFLIQLF